MKIRLTAAITAVMLSTSVYAEKTKEEHLNALGAGTDADKILACKFLGNAKKDKTAVGEIINTLNATDNNRVAIACAVALGYIGEKGEATSALRKKIESTNNKDLVYSALLAIYNISAKNKTVEDDAKAAYEYAKANHADDRFIADAVAKIENVKNGS